MINRLGRCCVWLKDVGNRVVIWRIRHAQACSQGYTGQEKKHASGPSHDNSPFRLVWCLAHSVQSLSFTDPAKALRSSSTTQLALGQVHLMLQLSRTPVVYLSAVGTTASGRMLCEPWQHGTTTPSSP